MSEGEGGDAARRRINEVKWRNLGGNMETIAGFNLEYNDVPPTPTKDPDPRWQPPPPVNSRGRPLFTATTERSVRKQAGKVPGFEVVAEARARRDGKALRASDGAVLKCPYVVRLKGH
jgi:hypothetical protein